jgi:hypothetical protein
MLTDTVYIKFGTYHGTKGTIVGESVKAGYPSYLIQTHDGNIIEKKQRNVVRMIIR